MADYSEKVILGVITVVLITALVPTAFTSIAAMVGNDNISSWVPTLFQVIVGAGLAIGLYRMFLKGKQ